MVTINLTFALILEIEFRCQSLRDKMKYDSKYEIFFILVTICEHIDVNGK